MDQVRFFALGGLGENGKNMYILEVSNDIFIMDAGIKFPGSELYGVDEIIPDYKMLIKAKKRIKGIFLTHAHEDHIGALPYILKDISTPVYATRFTLECLKDALIEANIDISEYQFNEVKQETELEFGNTKITFFYTAHSIPGSIGVAIYTNLGYVVYTGNFTFDQNIHLKDQTNFRKLNDIASKKVLLLLTESIGSGIISNPTADFELKRLLETTFLNASGRIVVSLFSSDFRNTERIIKMAIIHKKKIIVIGRRAERIIEIAASLGYLKIPKDLFTTHEETLQKNDSNVIYLVTGNRHEPFYLLQRMAKKIDKTIEICQTDTVIVLTSPVPGTEKMAARTLDILYRTDAVVKNINRKMISPSHATSSEIKMMINILRPKFIVPVIGEYMHECWVKKIALEVGFSEKNIFIMDSGDVLAIDKSDLYVSAKDISTGEILIDGTPLIDSNDLVMRDRELLAEDGCLIIVANINPRLKQIIGPVSIVTKGFVYIKESSELLEEIKKCFFETSVKHLNGKYINWNDFKRDVKENISKYIHQQIKRNPITIPVIVAIENE